MGLDKNNTLHENTLNLGTSYCTITEITAHVSPNKDVNACIQNNVFKHSFMCYTVQQEMTTI